MTIKLCEAPLTPTESAGVETSAQSDQIKLALLKQKCQWLKKGHFAVYSTWFIWQLNENYRSYLSNCVLLPVEEFLGIPIIVDRSIDLAKLIRLT